MTPPPRLPTTQLLNMSNAAFDSLASFMSILAMVALVGCCYACLLMQRRAKAREERARLADSGVRYMDDGRVAIGGAGGASGSAAAEVDGGELIEMPAAQLKVEQL
jgi:hypothetical protein